MTYWASGEIKLELRLAYFVFMQTVDLSLVVLSFLSHYRSPLYTKPALLVAQQRMTLSLASFVLYNIKQKEDGLEFTRIYLTENMSNMSFLGFSIILSTAMTLFSLETFKARRRLVQFTIAEDLALLVIYYW